jgi:hypothetical protein
MFPTGLARVGFLVSRYGYDFRAAQGKPENKGERLKNSRKNKRREKSRAGCRDL